MRNLLAYLVVCFFFFPQTGFCKTNAIDSFISRYVFDRSTEKKHIFIRVDSNIITSYDNYGLKNLRKVSEFKNYKALKHVSMYEVFLKREIVEDGIRKVFVSISIDQKKGKGEIFIGGEGYHIIICDLGDHFEFYLEGGLKPVLIGFCNA